MKILITGASGLLGGRLAQYLIQQQKQQRPEILLGTRRSKGWPNEAVMDFHQQDNLREVCHGVTAVVHLAGPNAAQCASADEQTLAADVQAMSNLLHRAIEQGVRRFIYVSTMHVYGASEGYIDEHTPALNIHPYALNHLAKESLLLNAHRQGLIEGVVVRLSNAFGAPVDMSANCWMLLVNDLCRQGARDHQLVLKSAGTQRRDFVPIRFVCGAMWHLLTMDSKLLSAEPWHVSGQFSPRVIDMAKRIQSRFTVVFGKTPELHHPPAELTDQPGNLDYAIQKLRSSGYSADPLSLVDDEIDDLITACLYDSSVNTQ